MNKILIAFVATAALFTLGACKKKGGASEAIGKVIAEQVELYGTLTGEQRAPEPAQEPQPNVVPFRKAEEA